MGGGVRLRAELATDDAAPSPEEVVCAVSSGGSFAARWRGSTGAAGASYAIDSAWRREPRTLAAIGADLHLSRERVRQIQERALIDLAHQPDVSGLRTAA